MAVSITGYGGVGEIGGNKFLLEDGASRFLLDFGTAFGRRQRYFNELLRPRVARGLLDLLALDLIPPLEGLYRDDLAYPGLWERFRSGKLYRNLRRGECRPAVDGVFISHAHLDHNGDLSFLDPAVTVYSTRASAFIARAMQVTGVSSFDRELMYANPRALSKTGELQADRSASYQVRPCRFLDGALSPEAAQFWRTSPGSRKEMICGTTQACDGACAGLLLRFFPVDHSVPGAAAIAVQTSAGWIAYTGDIRFHGGDGALTRRFAEELAKLRPRALLCEGTHLGAGPVVSETEVGERAIAITASAAGRLAIADFGPRNLERLRSFLDVAEATGRTLVAAPKDIYMLEALSLADPDRFPSPFALPHLGVYADPKASLKPWEGELRQRWQSRTVGPADVSARPGDYILCFSLWDANDLLDLVGVAGGAYLYSNSRAYEEEQAIDLQRLRHWVGHMGLSFHGDPDDPRASPLHASGHAPGPDLLRLVLDVRPRTLIPIHTEDAGWWHERLSGSGIEVLEPEVGVPLVLG